MEYTVSIIIIIVYLVLYEWIRIHKVEYLSKYVGCVFLLFGIIFCCSFQGENLWARCMHMISNFIMFACLAAYLVNVPREKVRYEIEQFLNRKRLEYHDVKCVIHRDNHGKRGLLKAKRVIEKVDRSINNSAPEVKERIDMNIKVTNLDKWLLLSIRLGFVEEDVIACEQIAVVMENVIKGLHGSVNQNGKRIATTIII